jgi:hypothetical protein
VIELTPTGFRKLARAGGPALFSVEWATVREIVTWKDDLLTLDMINLGFRSASGAEFLAVDEQNQGWKELGDRLPSVFPGLETDWWPRVTRPAFALNWRTIWGEPTPADQAACRR